jgi:predicted DNA-binding transcriptional regulator YafY
MKTEMRRRLAREPFEEKIQKAGQLVRLAKEFPRQPPSPAARSTAAAKEKTIVDALRNRQVLEFSYNGHPRIVEPQSYGLGKRTEHPVMRGFQRTGGSISGYTRGLRLFELAKISELRRTGEQFAKAQPGHNPNDTAMSKVIISLPRPIDQ